MASRKDIELKRYKALYRRNGVNPFPMDYRQTGGSISSITADVPNRMSLKTITRMAKEKTPEDYTFIRVERMVEDSDIGHTFSQVEPSVVLGEVGFMECPYPEYRGQICFCVNCRPIGVCAEVPCSVCDGPVQDCDPSELEPGEDDE